MPPKPNGEHYHGLLGSEPNCASCPLRKQRKVYPDGPVPARLAFVGEAPSYREEEQGRCFVGPSGELMWEQLGPAVGIHRENVWVTNAILCKLSPVTLENGARLSIDMVRPIAAACCRQRLYDELAAVQPEVIVPLGNTALVSLTGIGGAKIMNYRGSIMNVDVPKLAEDYRAMNGK